jgi:hypothetical protein
MQTIEHSSFLPSISLTVLALASVLSSSSAAREADIAIRERVFGKCYEFERPGPPGGRIILCFEKDGSLSGVDFDRTQGAEIASRWAVNAGLIIGSELCRVELAKSEAMRLANCLYKGTWTVRTRPAER